MSTILGGPFFEKSTDMDITWSLKQVPDRLLSVHVRITNLASADLYLLDRLWRLDASSRIMTDPQMVYRFVRDGSLRLLLGAAPLPTRYEVTYRNVPHATRMTPGQSHERTLSVAEPVTEYSPYFRAADATVQHAERVNQLILLVEYIVADPTLTHQPAPEDHGAVDLVDSGAGLAKAKLLIARAPFQLNVLRRTDKFDRITLPGEQPEP